MSRLKQFASLALVLLLANAATAYAQDKAALTDEQVKVRLNFISDALKVGRRGASTWLYGWIAAGTAGAAAGGALAGVHWNDTKLVEGVPVLDRAFAQDMLVGGAASALAAVGLIIDPFVPASAPGKLRQMPEGTPAERLDKLRRAEELLRQCARREKGGRSLTTHLTNIGVNAAAGVVTAAAFKRPWTDGLVTFAAGEAVALLTIFTQPMRATRDLKKYEAGLSGNDGTSSSGTPERKWSLGIWPGGLSLRLQF